MSSRVTNESSWFLSFFDKRFSAKFNFEPTKNLFFINDIHWNKRGNLLVSNEILEKIDF